ncbi:hypothetical protein B0T16DRAFT_403358 [Cercophora newfieldiana]|uniref:Uncharacterized protein n=1 Tax=Cercophora newfieldiana TaxID=92897 RepID=A0AA40CTW0_9PEZI|nr:hypothetical protein B0T16DRAFT_403358 [Cercophora newfieldiana]
MMMLGKLALVLCSHMPSTYPTRPDLTIHMRPPKCRNPEHIASPASRLPKTRPTIRHLTLRNQNLSPLGPLAIVTSYNYKTNHTWDRILPHLPIRQEETGPPT